MSPEGFEGVSYRIRVEKGRRTADIYQFVFSEEDRGPWVSDGVVTASFAVTGTAFPGPVVLFEDSLVELPDDFETNESDFVIDRQAEVERETSYREQSHFDEPPPYGDAAKAFTEMAFGFSHPVLDQLPASTWLGLRVIGRRRDAAVSAIAIGPFRADQRPDASFDDVLRAVEDRGIEIVKREWADTHLRRPGFGMPDFYTVLRSE
jgi:hypothetical protein